jgi:aminopeptidase
VIEPDAFAALLCDYCLEAGPGDQVLVRSTTLAAPLLLALQRALLEREAWPLMRPSLPEQEAGFWAAARDAHLDGFAPADLAEAEAADAVVRIDAPANTRALAGVDPARMQRAARARMPLREATLALRWCGTLCRRRRPRSRPAWRPRTSRRSSAAPCSSTATTRSAPGAP